MTNTVALRFDQNEDLVVGKTRLTIKHEDKLHEQELFSGNGDFSKHRHDISLNYIG